MKYAKFFEAITKFYGQYPNEFVEDVVLKYVTNNYTEDQLPDILAKLFKKYSNKYKTPPDVAVFEDLFVGQENDTEVKAIAEYEQITRTGHIYNDVFFEDIRSQATIEAMGGWTTFCMRDPQYESLHRKDFIKLFKLYTKRAPENRRKVLRGLSERTEPVLYGNRDRCLELLEKPNSEMVEQAENLAKKIGHYDEAS